MTDKKNFTTIQDAIDYEVEPALGEYASDYDVEAIAREFFDVYDEHDGFYASDDDDARFWAIVEKHDISD